MSGQDGSREIIPRFRIMTVSSANIPFGFQHEFRANQKSKIVPSLLVPSLQENDELGFGS